MSLEATPLSSAEAAYPASFSQERFWFLDRLTEGGPVGNLAGAYELDGPLDVDALRAALAALVERHEALRTRLELWPSGLVQVVSAPKPAPLAVDDLSDGEDAENEGWREALREAAMPFDLGRGPLVRARLLRIAPSRHLLVLGLHHAIADDWSFGILHQELGELYAAFVDGRPPNLGEVVLQYGDFAAWQREVLAETLPEELAWWRERLEGAPPLLKLPTDRPRPAVQTFRGGRVPFELEPDVVDRVSRLARRLAATPYMVLLATFELLLTRYSGQREFLVGMPVANRGEPGTEDIVGLFVNTLPVRAKLNPAATFAELVEHARDRVLDSLGHAETPFEQIVADVSPMRDASHLPLVQAMLVLQQEELTLALPGVRLTAHELPVGTSQLDLTLVLRPHGARYAGFVAYNTDLFDERRIARFAAGFAATVARATADPAARVGAIRTVGPDEERMLVACRGDDLAVPNEPVHAMFERWAARTPEAPAVVFERQTVSYAELNERANRLARVLRARGVGTESLVGVCGDRSPLMVATLLAVLKAGAAYVPLDPSYPLERLRLMIADSGVELVVTERALPDTIPATGVERLVIENIAYELARERADDLRRLVDPDALAYVIYTSGSTGRPKGVMVRHLALTNHVLAKHRCLRLGPGRRVLQFAPLAFDASVHEIFPTLTSGGELAVVRQDAWLEAASLSTFLRTLEVNIATLPPSLLAAAQPDDIPDLDTLISAGEQCTPAVVDAWAPGRRLLNAYGPTEVTVGPSISDPVRPGDPITIGRPFPNTRLLVLDDDLELTPLGVPGELFVGGIGVARGYLGRPDLTAERFLPDPFGEEPGARMYRTGDRVVMREDGQIAFLERIDRQVKIRGYRIEPGEVEFALTRLADVASAAVVAAPGPGVHQLVAFVVPTTGREPDPLSMRDALAAELPHYMVPSRFVVVPRFTTTPNGKVDRAELACQAIALEPERSAADGGRIRPRTSVEEALAKVWEEILGRAPIGVGEPFFELGGRSLEAAQLVNRIEQTFGVSIPLVTLVNGGTVETLATAIETASPAGRRSPLVVLRSGAKRPTVYLPHAASGLAVPYIDFVRTISPARRVVGIESPSIFGEGEDRTIEEMATAYLPLLATDEGDGPLVIAGYSLGALIALELAVQATERGWDLALLALIDPPLPERAAPKEVVGDASFWLWTYGDRSDLSATTMRAAPHEDAVLDHVLDALERAGTLPRHLRWADRDRSRRLLRTLKTNRLAGWVYLPPRYAGDVTVFFTREDAEQREEAWRQRLPRASIVPVSGTHDECMRLPRVRTIAEELERRLRL